MRFEQVAGGVPVYDGLVTVHLARGADALKGFTAGVSKSTAGAARQPSISADQARDVAATQVADTRLVQAPQLVVYTGVPLGSLGRGVGGAGRDAVLAARVLSPTGCRYVGS